MVEGGPASTIVAARTTATGEGRPWRTAEYPASCDQSDGRSVEAHSRSNVDRECGLEEIDWNRPSSDKRASSSNEGKSTGMYPVRLRLANRRLSRVLSAASVKPHQAGEAYSSEAIEVILATRRSSSGRRPCNLNMRRAYPVEAQCCDYTVYVITNGKSGIQGHSQHPQGLNTLGSRNNRFNGKILSK